MKQLKLIPIPIPILTLLFLFACQSSQKNKKLSIQEQVEALTTTEFQVKFLEEIGILDQKVRNDASDAKQNFGYKSKEHKASLDRFVAADSLNEQKINLYLASYGHPSIEKHGKIAAHAPWLVIHHTSDPYESRDRNFKYLYEAYRNDDIDDSLLTLYLNRWYQMEFDKRIKWDRPYRVGEELDTLFKSLRIEDQVKEIDSKFTVE